MFLLCLAVGFGVLSALLMPKTYAVGAGERLIMIHDRGTDHGLITRAKTLRQVFQETHINLDKNDRVEPGLDDELVANSYQVNVYRAHPVVIVDGPVKQLVMTAYQTPKQIAKDAGIELRDEDQASLDFTNNFVADGASIRMTIDRATPVALTLYGKTDTVYTQATTVGEFMKEKNIRLGEKDDMSAKASTPVTSGMQLSIWRNGKQTITQEEDIAFDIQKIQDADRDLGFKQVNTAGVNGKKTVTYEIIMQDGKEVSRTVIQSVVTKQPVTQVETEGIKVVLPAGSHEDWMAAAGISASDYGYVNYIVSHEGGWEPCKVQGGAINCSYSGSMGYGLVQATPGSKMGTAGADWRTNPITQLKWATGYAVGRYGSWGGAYQHWLSAHSW
jgi:uncharacterized protein YabE (DUF348 family)